MLAPIEEAVYNIKRGEKSVVKCVFPIHSELAYMRGRQRLIECTLLDVKKFGYPPVVEDDLQVGEKSGRYVA